MDFVKIRIEKNLADGDENFQRSVDQMFRIMNPFSALSNPKWHPHTDIFETEDEIVIKVELAGVKIEDIHVEMDGKTLKIYGKRSELVKINAKRYILAEIPSGNFERTFRLSCPMDTDNVTAIFTDGMLSICLIKLPHSLQNVPVHCI